MLNFLETTQQNKIKATEIKILRRIHCTRPEKNKDISEDWRIFKSPNIYSSGTKIRTGRMTTEFPNRSLYTPMGKEVFADLGNGSGISLFRETWLGLLT